MCVYACTQLLPATHMCVCLHVCVCMWTHLKASSVPRLCANVCVYLHAASIFHMCVYVYVCVCVDALESLLVRHLIDSDDLSYQALLVRTVVPLPIHIHIDRGGI